MTHRFPPAPTAGKPLLPTRASADARALLALRRSAGKTTLTDPGPDPALLRDLMTIAARVPDHRKLEPWRFITIEGEARAQLGSLAADLHQREMGDVSTSALNEDRTRFLRAPLVIAVVSSPNRAHKTPVWEQELSAGAVCQNLLLAANAAGFAGVWLTEWVAYSPGFATALGLSDAEQIAGLIYIGTASAHPPERPRPIITDKVTSWSAP